MPALIPRVLHPQLNGALFDLPSFRDIHLNSPPCIYLLTCFICSLPLVLLFSFAHTAVRDVPLFTSLRFFVLSVLAGLATRRCWFGSSFFTAYDGLCTV